MITCTLGEKKYTMDFVSGRALREMEPAAKTYGKLVRLSQDAVEALSRGEWSAEVDRGTLLLIYGYYGITPAQMLGDDGI